MVEKDRVTSFSYRQTDKEAVEAIRYIKTYCRSKGVSFSFMVLKAIKKLAEEMRNEP